MQKHIQLGISMKRKNGSRNVIEWLNRLGHSLSYKEVNVIETSLAEEHSNLEAPRKYVPNNIQPSTMVTFVYDNCDHNAESIHGFTMHATNGIVIQRTSDASPNDSQQLISSTAQRQRRDSFKPICRELMPYITSKTKENPEAIADVDENSNNFSAILSTRQSMVPWSL